MPINIPLHNIGQDRTRDTATSSEYSMPDLAMCNVTYRGFRKSKKLCPGKTEGSTQNVAEYAPSPSPALPGPEKWKYLTEIWIILVLWVKYNQSFSVRSHIYRELRDSLAKTRNEIKRESVYISLFLFAFSVGRFQIWYSLFPSILSQQICFSLSYIYNFCIWCIHFVFSLKENPFRAKDRFKCQIKI